MNKRNYLIYKAILFSLTPCLILVVLLTQDIDTTGIYLSIVMAAVMLFFAFRFYKQSKITGTEEKMHTPYAPAANATNAEQIKYYTRMIWMSSIAFSILTWIIASDLNDLESGQAASVSIWAPVSFVYEKAGYWPAVLSLPLLALAAIAVFLFKIKKIKEEDTITKEVDSMTE